MIVCLRRVLRLVVLVWVMRMTIGGVGMLVMVPETEVLEDPGLLEKVVRHVIVLVRVRHRLVRVLVVRLLRLGHLTPRMSRSGRHDPTDRVLPS